MILVVYVDDILLTGSNVADIVKAKEYLKTVCDQRHGQAKIRHFLGIEISTHIKHVVFFLNENMLCHLLQEIELLSCKCVRLWILMLWDETGPLFGYMLLDQILPMLLD